MSNTRAIGIDFGTSNSCVSVFDTLSGVVKVIPNSDGQLFSPSSIFLNGNSFCVGLGASLTASVSNFKRLVGITWQEYEQNCILQNFFKMRGARVTKNDDNLLAFQFDNQIVSVSFLVKMYFKWLLGMVREHTSDDMDTPYRVVLTVPAYFTEAQRSIIKWACEANEGNVKVIRILNEPTAAALAYGQCLDENCNTENVLVVDCGGGTTDISLIHMDYANGLYEVMAVEGDNYLGGEDITQNLVKYIRDKFDLYESVSLRELKRVEKECDNVKCQLSFSLQATVFLEHVCGKDLSLTITRAQFNQINQRFIDTLKQQLNSVALGYKVDKVVFVGGSTKIPFFKETALNLFGREIDVCSHLDPECTISIGAALHAASLLNLLTLEKQKDTVVMDVLNMTIGVETDGGIMVPVVSKNTLLPVSRTKTFTNSQDNMSELTINIYQGERKLVNHNILIGSLVLEGLDVSQKKGNMTIRITFDIDQSSMIHVYAHDTTTNVAKRIHIQSLLDKFPSIEDDHDFIISDSIAANKITAMLELQDTFDFYQNLYRTNKYKLTRDTNKIDILMTNVQQTISDFKSFDVKTLRDKKTQFESTFHKLFVGQDK